jgi:hypothetical protein
MGRIGNACRSARGGEEGSSEGCGRFEERAAGVARRHDSNVTIYLPADVEHQVRKAAKAGKVSVSKWVAERVIQSIETSWSPEFLALAGAFPDFPDAAELRKGYGKDVPRESVD